MIKPEAAQAGDQDDPNGMDAETEHHGGGQSDQYAFPVFQPGFPEREGRVGDNGHDHHLEPAEHRNDSGQRVCAGIEGGEDQHEDAGGKAEADKRSGGASDTPRSQADVSGRLHGRRPRDHLAERHAVAKRRLGEPLFFPHGHFADLGDHRRAAESRQPQSKEGQKELLNRRCFTHESISLCERRMRSLPRPSSRHAFGPLGNRRNDHLCVTHFLYSFFFSFSSTQGCSVSPWHSLICSRVHSSGFPFNFSGY